MNIKEQIKAEIERRYKEFNGKTGDIATASRLAYLDVLSYLDTLLEQPASEDLETAAIDFADGARKGLIHKDYAISSIADYDHGCIDGFKAGAQWQKEQIIGIIESRIAEILGDAQPNSVLRIELQGIIDKIK